MPIVCEEFDGMSSPATIRRETPEPPPERPPFPPSARHRVEYWAVRSVLGLLGLMPHRLARAACAALAALSYWLWPRLRRVGLWNLRLAYPGWTPLQRRRVLFASFQSLGRMLADFAHFPGWNRGNIEQLVVYDGYENYERARRLGKGLIFLTAHFGGWELGSFAHGVYGHPVNFVMRRLDNPLIDSLINRYRCGSGARPIEKSDFARQALRALRRGESVGILMDQNMMPGEGVFADFFGCAASTTTMPARMARKTGSPLVLGLVIWDAKLRKYRLRFDPVEWIAHEDPDEEIALNTANFTKLLEGYIRRYPEQWLWMHRRWKTRPPDEPPVYPF
ncbi:MAG TPA: lysophospholipid acyltransferase family protein [Terriglobia bacterium]|nr:lysophospholipid acyltransferase family protein [Terriglobia bacterium]